MDKGTLVEFRHGGKRHLAVIERPEGKKHLIAIDERGQSYTLHPREIDYAVSGETFQPQAIPAFQQAVEPLLDPASLEVAWELLVEDNEPVDPPTLAQLLFSTQDAVHCYAAYHLLSDDKLYFKQRKDNYEPRTIAQVNDLKHQAALALQRQQQWDDFLSRIHQGITGESLTWQSYDRPYLDALERFATWANEAKNIAPALELLAALKRPETSEAAFQLLSDLRIWSPHENLYLRRSQTPTVFSPKVLDVALSCLSSPPSDPDTNRLDLTHLKVYTIDDESTREIDDGLSLETLEDGRQRLWIHIADPTRWLQPGDDLDLEARRRGTTVYLPEQVVPMFPVELATGPMSLVQGQVCCALSFGVILDEQGAIADYRLHASHIKPTYRLTYDDVDEMLQLGVVQEPELVSLNHQAQQRQKWRRSQGSITIRMPEAVVKVKADGEITIEVLEDSSSRQLVAEMMILAGEVAGRYGQAHNLAIPFRNQPQPELPPDEELLILPAGPVRDCAIRRCMPRSEVSLTPARHASLALETYTQVTSPIRRYSDLLAHFQIKAHLRGEPLPFAPEQMQDLILSLGSVSYEAVQLERQTKQYWALEYLRRQRDCHWTSLFLRWLREYENLGLVLLEDLGLELAVRLDRKVALGDRLTLRVAHVDPRRDVIQVQEVLESAA